MFIGSNSKSTVFEVLHIGLRELVRAYGVPSEVRFKGKGCRMMAKSADLTKRVDKLDIEFKLKPDTDPGQVAAALAETKLGARQEIKEDTCTITTPGFDWRQLSQLLPLDKIVNDFALHSPRSQTWTIEVRKYLETDFNINALIEEMKARNASDLHLRAGNRPFLRIDNDLVAMDMPIISAEDMREVILKLGGESELDILETERESSFQYHAAGLGYLRCSGYIKSGAKALAIRHIPEEPVPFDKLGIPQVIKKICRAHRGLFLVCGITGSGKSTTLAAMLDLINSERPSHIITVEDPVEFVYKDRKSIISQRQVGRDTYSFANALRGALREDPDVILVGEMRDTDTIRAGLSAAETGHLVFSTLHTTTAVDTVNRIISYFPQNERDLIRQELAYTLQGVVCQRLLKKIGGGRVPCVEIMLGGRPIVRDAILEGDIEKLHNIIEVDSDMKSFDQYAVELYQQGIVTREEAISACSNEEGFNRVVSGIRSSEGRKLLK